MANTKISDLNASTLSTSDFVPVSRAGSNYKISLSGACDAWLSGNVTTGSSPDNYRKVATINANGGLGAVQFTASEDAIPGPYTRQNYDGFSFVNAVDSTVYLGIEEGAGETTNIIFPVFEGTGKVAISGQIIDYPLVGFSNAYGGAITAADSILSAIGKLENKSENVFYSDIGGVISADTTVSGRLSADKIKINQTSQASQASTVLDFNGYGWVSLSSLSGNVTFSTTNRAQGYELSARLVGGTGAFTFTFPSWVFVGGVAPTSLAAGKTGILSLRCFGTAETDVIASYAVQS